ncbi:hypothetical protein EDB81DRAFT_898808 [Dactylonectria macrodidyma]|uniref:Uncharacterized protein n=1 Tax=Dactylonectria macrodidyma TaxID=307937 RepID=A0A9P9J170_9HYPO|nr:hypothetical protein EDB81DRAFT_898808 [Dactylonectria macrodidyma]
MACDTSNPESQCPVKIIGSCQDEQAFGSCSDLAPHSHQSRCDDPTIWVTIQGHPAAIPGPVPLDRHDHDHDPFYINTRVEWWAKLPARQPQPGACLSCIFSDSLGKHGDDYDDDDGGPSQKEAQLLLIRALQALVITSSATGNTDDNQDNNDGQGTVAQREGNSSLSSGPGPAESYNCSNIISRGNGNTPPLDKKRPPSGDPPDGHDPKKSRADSPSSEAKRLACPYFKHDPDKYWQCSAFNPRSVADVRQHLKRSSNHPPQRPHCPRCNMIFDDSSTAPTPSTVQQQRDAHIRECDDLEKGPEVPGLTQDLIHRIRHTTLTGSEREKWFALWDMIFPDTSRPRSPYVESVRSQVVDMFQHEATAFLQSRNQEQAVAPPELHIYDLCLFIITERGTRSLPPNYPPRPPSPMSAMLFSPVGPAPIRTAYPITGAEENSAAIEFLGPAALAPATSLPPTPVTQELLSHHQETDDELYGIWVHPSPQYPCYDESQ